jgi:hypothetical protein
MSGSCKFCNQNVFALRITDLRTLVTGKFLRIWGFPHAPTSSEPWLSVSTQVMRGTPCKATWRQLCRPRSDWRHHGKLRCTQQAGQCDPSKESQVGATRSLLATWLPDWGFSCFSSSVRQMSGCNSKGARPAFPNHWGLQPKLFAPTSGYNSQKATQSKSFSYRTCCLMGYFSTSSNIAYLDKSRPSATTKSRYCKHNPPF